MSTVSSLLAALFTFAGTAAASAAPAAAAPAPEAEVRVLILLFDGVQIIDFAAPYEVFGQAKFAVQTVSPDGQPVQTAMGLHVQADHSLAEAPTADIVVVPGGDVEAASKDERILDWLRARAPSTRQLMSVCTGSDILARTGLLDGHRATTFHKHFEHFEAQFPAVELARDQRWVDAGNIVTSAGLASGIDTALHVVSRLRGEATARRVALHLEYDWSPTGGFVRGLLADQYIRLPDPPIAWPEHTKFTEIASAGDRTEWSQTFSVKSELKPADLLALVARHVQADADLELLPASDPQRIAWRYASARGGRWRVRLTTAAAAAAPTYQLELQVSRLP